MNCEHCQKPLTGRQSRFCCAEHHRIANREAPRSYDDRLRELAALGHSYSRISAELGIDKHRLVNRAITLGIAKEAAKSGKAQVYLPEQEEILRRMYPGGAEFEQIEPLVNAVPGGYRLRNKKQLWAWAKARKLVRSSQSVSIKSRQQAQAYWNRRKAETPAPVKTERQPIQIHLREIYQHGFTLDLPHDQRGDLDALNRAIRRDDPGHPGFALANRLVSRVGLYAR